MQTTDALDSKRISKKYNSLPTIFAADAALSKIGREKVIGELGKLILKFRLEKKIGLRLVHYHNALSEREIMYMEQALIEGAAVLVNQPIDPTSLPVKPWPASWVCSDGKYEPIEFVLPGIVDSFDSADGLEEFFSEFAEVAASLSVLDTVGPCIDLMPLLERADGSRTGHVFIESVDDESRANSLTIVNRASAPLTTVDAAWSIRRGPNELPLVTVVCSCFYQPEATQHSGAHTNN
jgi:hypothetical protein